MLSLSAKYRYFNRRVLWIQLSRPRNLLYAGILGTILWLTVLHGGSIISGRSDVLSLREKRYRDYQESEASREGYGEQGKSVKLSPEDQEKYQQVNQKEGFNFRVSEMVALDRSIPDKRSLSCRKREYDTDLPKASVIIAYHNEAFSVIMRTVHSVINRSPPQYLEEVVLLDDSSTREDVLEPMHTYIGETWPDGIVRVVRTPERYGLIKGKLYGAQAAKGPVLIFLDAHCEASPGWIEPLLHDIKEDPSRVICPVITNIDSETLQFFGGGSSHRGGFWWSMHFSWEPRPAHEVEASKGSEYAYPSPTMAGGLFATDKAFFFHIGAYDDKMEIWGGENLDLSFRAWMCKGSLTIHPCSQVGHIFRATHPYGFPDKERDYHGINSKRVAEVWMDGYKRYYYYYRQSLPGTDVGDLTERHAIRKSADCHDFKWFLDNVYPEKFRLDENVQAFGNVRNAATNMCFDNMNYEEKYTYTHGLYGCHKAMTSMNQIFSLTYDGQIRREGTCMTVDVGEAGEKDKVEMSVRCKDSDPRQIWLYEKNGSQLQNKQTKTCLDVSGLQSGNPLQLKPCDGSHNQMWEWTNYYSKQTILSSNHF